MATSKQITDASKGLETIPGMLSVCEQVAAAMIETGQEWAATSAWAAMLSHTDYERARNRIQWHLRLLKEQLRRIRKSQLSPDSIRAYAFVESLQKACEACVKVNRQNIAAGKTFVCLAKREIEQAGPREYRFRLDGKGNIVESR